jgi:hypothetical protein
MKHLLVIVYKVFSNKSPGVKIGLATGVSLVLTICVKNTGVKIGPAPDAIDFPYISIAKT